MSLIERVTVDRRVHVTTEFEIPEEVPPSPRHIYDIWASQKLMRTDMPLEEDFDLVLLRDYADRIFVADVADSPPALRIESARWRVVALYCTPLAGHQIENISEHPPLDDLWAQCMAAVRDCRPVFYRHHTAAAAYDRIILPLWGERRVEKLVGAISDAAFQPGEFPSLETAS
jgi:hypothetical protein